MMQNRVFIVIPALNESERIEKTILSIHSAGYQNVVVVDDGSDDETFEVTRGIVDVIRHPIHRGYGAALSTGMQYALDHGAEVVVHFDADGQHSASEIGDVIRPIVSGAADVVFGSRYLDRRSDMPLTKKYLIHKPALVVQQLTTGLRFTDVHNGFRAFSRNAAQSLRMYHDGMAYASEIVYEIRRLRLRYVEVPVTIAYREYGQGIISGLRIYCDLLVKKLFKQ